MYLACLVFLLAVGIISLSTPIIRAAENIWNIQRNPGPGAGTNDLDFYLTSNQVTGSSLRLTANGSMFARNLYDLNNSTFYLNPDETSVLKSLNVTSLNTSGNLGVGAAVPGEKLDVNGNARIAQGGYLKFAHTSQQDINDGKIGAGLFAPGLNLVGIRTDGAYRKLGLWGEITQQQNDGFNTFRGVTTVNGGVLAASSANLRPGALAVGNYGQNYGGGQGWTNNVAGLFLEADNNTEIAVHDAGTRLASLMFFEGAGTNRITIGRNMGWDAIKTIALNGNVGIGTPTPANPLSFGTSLFDTQKKLALYEQAGGAVVYGFGITAGSLDVYAGGNKVMALNQNGRVGIRNGAPVNDLHLKQSSNNWNSGGGMRFERSDSGGFGSIFEGSDNALYLVANSGTYFCAVTANTTMYCSSDGRLKENISPLNTSALDVLSRLQPSTFNWKSSGARSAGFIAQEVKEVLPEAVTFSEDLGYYGLSDSYFTPYMVKGIQELNDQIKSQHSEIDLLKIEIEELKKSKE